MRASVGTRATSFGWQSKGAKGMSIVDGSGSLAAVAQVRQLSQAKVSEKFGDGIPKGPYMEVMDLATRERGWGRQIMQDVVDKSSKTGTGLILRAAKDAEGFYQKLGMTQDGNEPVYYFTAAQCKEYARASEVLPVVSDEDEPIEFIEVEG